MNITQNWHTSSYSANGGECVEVAEGEETYIRDTKNRDQGHLSFTSTEWLALMGAATL